MSAGPADKGLDTFKTLVYDPMIDLVVKKIVGLASFLSFGPISFLISAAVGFIANKIYEELGLTVNFQYVLLQDEQYHSAYVAANHSLREVAKAKGIDSPEFKEARDARLKALAKFARYSGT